MSVQNQTVKNVYAGNGSTTVFPFTFALLETDGEFVKVYVTNEAGTSEETTNFTIDTQAKTVTYPTTGDPLPADRKIVIRRELPNEQELNLENLGPFFAEDVEGEFDRVVMMIQQLQEEAERSVKVDMASDHTPEEFLQDISDAVETAKDYADAAQDSADDADASVTKAAKWAEGSDADVSALGGTHSSKGWSDVSKGHSDDASGYATAASGSAASASAYETNAAYWAEGTDGQVAPLGGTHSAKGWAAEAQTSADAAAAAASTVVAAHNNSPNAHADLLHLRQNSKVYAVGDITFSASLPSYLVLECTTPGTTAATEPDFSGAVEGGTVTDGAVGWTYKGLLSDDGANTDLSNLTATGEDHFLEQDSRIIYPNGGTEANPANIAWNSRYVETNPFPGYYIHCLVEIQYNGQWGNPEWCSWYSGSTLNANGVRANQLADDAIVIQTGAANAYVATSSVTSGNPFAVSTYIGSPAPCRVKVWKIGKI